MRLMVWSKARAMRQIPMESWVVLNHGRVPERVYGGFKAGIVNVNRVVLGSGTAKSSVLRPRYDVSLSVKGDAERR